MSNETRTPDSTLKQRLENLLPNGRYHDLRPLEGNEGKKKTAFRANQGTNGVTRPVIVFLNSDNAPGYLERGYGIANEASILSQIGIDEAIQSNIVPLLDYNANGQDEVLVVPEIKGAVSLKQWLEANGPLSARDFVSGMKGMFNGARLLNSHGIFHRDRHPANAIVRKTEKGLELFTIDTGSAVKKEDVRNGAIQTTLAKFSSDPLVGGFFTQENKPYNEGSEAYGLAFTALNTLVSKPPVLYDYRNGTAINNYTGESLLDEKGYVIPEKHQQAINQAIGQIPIMKRIALRKHLAWMKKALTLDSSKRYNKLEEMFSDFNEANESSRLTKIIAGTTAIVALGALAGAAALAYPLNRRHAEEVHTRVEQAVEKASKIPIIPSFDGYKLETRNPLFNLNFYINRDNPYEIIFDTEGQRKTFNETIMETKPIIELKRGEKYDVQLRPQKVMVLKHGMSGLEGKVYIEGFEGKTFYSDIIESDPTCYDMGGPNIPWNLNFTVPNELPDGSYALAVEMYAQSAPNTNSIDATSEIDYGKSWGKCIARKRIPFVVGKPTNALSVGMIRLGHYTSGYVSVDCKNQTNKETTFPSNTILEKPAQKIQALEEPLQMRTQDNHKSQQDFGLMIIEEKEKEHVK